MGFFSFVSRGKKSAKAPPRKKKSARRRLYELHTWVGFHLAVVMVVVLFTGTMATISNELDWLTQHDMRVSPDGAKVSYDEMLEAVEAYNPDATVFGIQHMMGDHFAYRVTVFDENATQQFIHVNQWTGDVTGQTPYFTFQRFFRDMHRYLYMPKAVGLTLVCSMGIILGISLYTGLKTSRNWGTLMTRIRFSKGPRTAIGDAHKAAGLWSIWFFVLMIATGLWYYAEFLGKDFEPGAPTELQNMTELTSDVLYNPAPDEIARIAEEAYPELKISSLNFAVLPGSAIRVMGKAGNPIVRDRANAVYIDPATFEIITVRRSGELPPVQWVNQIADPLHFGDFGGLPLKLIYFTFGAFMTGLSVSGVWLTWKRLKSRGASRMQLAALPLLVISALFASITATVSNLPILAGLNPMPYIWFVLGLFLACGAVLCAWWLRVRAQRGSFVSFKNAGIATLGILLAAGAFHGTLLDSPYSPNQEMALKLSEAGPVQAELFLDLSKQLEPTGQLRFVIRAKHLGDQPGKGGQLNLKRMTLALLKDGNPISNQSELLEQRFRLAARTQPVYFKVPKSDLSVADELLATFEMRSGETFDIAWRTQNGEVDLQS